MSGFVSKIAAFLPALFTIAAPALLRAQSAAPSRIASQITAPLELTPELKTGLQRSLQTWLESTTRAKDPNFDRGITCPDTKFQVQMVTLNNDAIPEIVLDARGSCIYNGMRGNSYIFGRSTSAPQWNLIASEIGGGFAQLRAQYMGYSYLQSAPGTAQQFWRWNGREYHRFCDDSNFGGNTCPRGMSFDMYETDFRTFNAASAASQASNPVPPPAKSAAPTSGAAQLKAAQTALEFWRARVNLDQLSGEQTGFARFIETQGGQLPGAVRDMWDQYGVGTSHMWLELPRGGKLGHAYLGLNSLGRWPLTAEEAFAVFARDLDATFPLGARGLNGPDVAIGHEFALMPLPQGLPAAGFHVKVAAVDAHSFRLQTQEDHPFVGSATHGIFRDSAGELWMFQEGYGPSGFKPGLTGTVLTPLMPPITRDWTNELFAKEMWQIMANRTTDLLAAEVHRLRR